MSIKKGIAVGRFSSGRNAITRSDCIDRRKHPEYRASKVRVYFLSPDELKEQRGKKSKKNLV